MKEGYLYVMRHRLFPDLYKIGKTKDTILRLKSLSSSSLPESFECVLSYPVRNKDKAESLAFSLLDDLRYADNKEFFYADFDQIMDVCNQVQRYINLGSPLTSSAITEQQIDNLTDRFSYYGEEY